MDPERKTKPRVTSQDVARRAGVSRSTVSIVLNRSNAVSISDATRARVFEAAAALDYSPNSAARKLVRGHTETLGLLASDPRLLEVDGFVPQLLYSIHHTAQRQGYRVLLEAVYATGHPEGYRDLVRGHHIDGLIVLNPKIDDAGLRALIDDAYPVVLLGSLRHPHEHSVNFSTHAAIAEIVVHLHALGRRRIAHITFAPPDSVATSARLHAYRRALERNGVEFDEALVAIGDYSAASGFAAMTELLPRRPDALLAGNDTIAFGAIAAIDEAGLRVPEDIAVVGFDDLPLARYARPPLTTVRNPAVLQGEIAVGMLIDLLRGEAPRERQVEVSTEFIVRESCGAKASAATDAGRASANPANPGDGS